jgi:hypothetical protein
LAAGRQACASLWEYECIVFILLNNVFAAAIFCQQYKDGRIIFPSQNLDFQRG